jgi:hypothetical protein
VNPNYLDLCRLIAQQKAYIDYERGHALVVFNGAIETVLSEAKDVLVIAAYIWNAGYTVKSDAQELATRRPSR